MNYNEILDKLIETDQSENPVKEREAFCRNRGAVVVVAAERIRKPFLSSTAAGTVGIAFRVDDKPDHYFAIFPSFGNMPVVGLVEKAEVISTGTFFKNSKQIFSLNEHDPEDWQFSYLSGESDRLLRDHLESWNYSSHTGWVRFTCWYQDRRYTGEAKIYHRPSRFGIYNGHISKMQVKRGGKEVAHYDRGWDYNSAPDGFFEFIVPDLESVVK